MDDLDKPKPMLDPEWTEKEYRHGGSRDDLGIETLGESILADLLPGINNQTDRARYYSFWAWVLRDFINDPHAQHTQRNLYKWLRRREAALILGNLSHDCGVNVAGTTIGRKVWGEGQKSRYDLNWKSMESVSGGAYQLYYRGVLQETNVIVSKDDQPHDELTNTIGINLADAYDKSVSGTKYVESYLDADQIRKQDIQDFAQAGCLCQISEYPEERQALIDTFFRFDTPDTLAVKRLASLCFLLDIIDQSDGYPLNEEIIRAALYFWGYKDHHDYVPTTNVITAAQRWRIFQLRQYFVYAVESFWSLFLHHIKIERQSEMEYIDWLIDNLNLASFINDFGVELDNEDPNQLTVEDYFYAIREKVTDGSLVPGAAAQGHKLNEQYLKENIKRERSRSNVTIHAGYGLAMLSLMYWRAKKWKNLPGYNYVSKPFAADRIPFNEFVDQVDIAIEEGWSLSRWLTWFHRHYLWLQHRRVALEKLSGRREDTSKFQRDRRDGEAVSRFKGIDVDNPKMNAPRFPSAISIFSDLELIEFYGQGMKLSNTGKGLLDKYRKFTVPEWQEPEEEHETTFDPEGSAGG